MIEFSICAASFFRPTVHTLTYIHRFRRLLTRLRDEFPFDIVHAHTSFLDGAARLMAARAHGCPLLITEHTGPFDLLTRDVLMRYRTEQSVIGASRVLAVSNSLRQTMLAQLALTPDRIRVMPNGVDARCCCQARASPHKSR